MKVRIKYVISVASSIVLGLASRKFAAYLPGFISAHAGDAIWAGMVYFGCRFLWPYKAPTTAFIVALVFSYLIEFSQLYQANWINNIRETTLGALVLGRGFLLVDLLRYLAGIIAAYLIDHYLILKNKTYGYREPS